MRIICITYEEQTAQSANFLAEILQENRYQTVLLYRKYFPIADTMIRYLFQLSYEYDNALVIIASDRSILWISKELRIQRNMGDCTNVYPAFVPAIAIPSWWIDKEAKYLIIDRKCINKVDLLLN
ncbi:MAG: hypothetical protein AAGF83_19380 [Cyanobacteria bacterium P01_G01_bin.67]